jgi:hypothetical protein
MKIQGIGRQWNRLPNRENYQLPLNPILARKDFPTKGLARYKKCQQRRNIYISEAVHWGDREVGALRQGVANPEFLKIGAIAESLAINVPSPLLGCPPTANIRFRAAGEKVAGCALTLEIEGK